MNKEKFLFELIDNYLYTASIGCMIMENYLLEDRTEDYSACADRLDACLEFYNQLYEKLDRNEYTEDEVDAILNYLIQSLKQETMRRIRQELSACIQNYVSDADAFIRENLLLDVNGRPQELNKRTLVSFIKKLRRAEEI